MRKIATIAGIAGGLLSPMQKALARPIDFTQLTGNPCPIDDLGAIQGVGCGTDPQIYIANLISGTHGLRTMFGGILLAMFIYYGIKLLLGSKDENTITEIKGAYSSALFGSILVAGAFFLADTFATANPTGATSLTNEAAFNTVTANSIAFFFGLVSSVALVNIVFQGIRLITAQEEGDIDKARKRFVHGMIGAGIVILSGAAVNSFFGINVNIATTEISGIAVFVVTIFGALAVIGIIIAGIMLVVSVEESLKDRAKKLIITSVVALAVVIASFGIVSTFL